MPTWEGTKRNSTCRLIDLKSARKYVLAAVPFIAPKSPAAASISTASKGSFIATKTCLPGKERAGEDDYFAVKR